MIQSNPAIRALGITGDFSITKIQPPDSMVVELPDGSKWNIMAHKQGRKDEHG